MDDVVPYTIILLVVVVGAVCFSTIFMHEFSVLFLKFVQFVSIRSLCINALNKCVIFTGLKKRVLSTVMAYFS